MTSIVPSATEVQEARELLRKYLRPTRLVRAESLERRSKGQVRLKIESDLPTGSFKPRGALFALLRNAERAGRGGRGEHREPRCCSCLCSAHREPGGYDLSPGKS